MMAAGMNGEMNLVFLCKLASDMEWSSPREVVLAPS